MSFQAALPYYARYTHGFFDLDRWEDFKRKIFVKQDGTAALERKLLKAALRGEAIAIGTATDPYQPAEGHRGILEVFARVEGLEISITTQSPLILRDLDLLAELDRRHAVSVNVTIATVDPALARRIEPHGPDPRARLRTVRRLAEEGIATSIFCTPVMPGINDSEEVLRPLLAAAREAGARDVMASILHLRPAARVLRYGRRDSLSESERQRLLGTFRRLRLEHGFPLAAPGRG